MTLALLLVGFVLIGGLLLVMAVQQQAQSGEAPEAGTLVFRDLVRIEESLLQAMGSAAWENSRDEALFDLARRLALELVEGASTPLEDGLGQSCPSWGGEVTRHSAQLGGEELGSEEQIGGALAERLGDLSPRSGEVWGCGVHCLRSGAGAVVLLGRLAWEWQERPSGRVQEGQSLCGFGRPLHHRWAQLRVRMDDGEEQPVVLVPSKKGEEGMASFHWRLPGGTAPGTRGSVLAGGGGDEVVVANFIVS